MAGQLHAGKLFGRGQEVWHTDSDGVYWTGCWHHRTARQLYEEAKTIIADLLAHHPELIEPEPMWVSEQPHYP